MFSSLRGDTLRPPSRHSSFPLPAAQPPPHPTVRVLRLGTAVPGTACRGGHRACDLWRLASFTPHDASGPVHVIAHVGGSSVGGRTSEWWGHMPTSFSMVFKRPPQVEESTHRASVTGSLLRMRLFIDEIALGKRDRGNLRGEGILQLQAGGGGREGGRASCSSAGDCLWFKFEEISPTGSLNAASPHWVSDQTRAPVLSQVGMLGGPG